MVAKSLLYYFLKNCKDLMKNEKLEKKIELLDLI